MQRLRDHIILSDNVNSKEDRIGNEEKFVVHILLRKTSLTCTELQLECLTMHIDEHCYNYLHRSIFTWVSMLENLMYL